MCLNFSFTFLLSSPIRCDRNLAGPLSGRYICFPGSSSTKHGLAHHNSQHSELKEWVKEKEGEREIVSYLSEACFAQGYVSLFSPFVSSPPSITQQQEAKRKKKEKKKKKGVTECSSRRNSILLSPKTSSCPGMKVQQVKETRVHTKGQSATNKVEVNTGIHVIN